MELLSPCSQIMFLSPLSLLLFCCLPTFYCRYFSRVFFKTFKASNLKIFSNSSSTITELIYFAYLYSISEFSSHSIGFLLFCTIFRVCAITTKLLFFVVVVFVRSLLNIFYFVVQLHNGGFSHAYIFATKNSTQQPIFDYFCTSSLQLWIFTRKFIQFSILTWVHIKICKQFISSPKKTTEIFPGEWRWKWNRDL